MDRRSLCRSLLLGSLALGASLLAVGCVTTGSSWLPGLESTPGAGICRLEPAWHKQILFAPDTTKNGQPTPGLAVRLYFFGVDIGKPMEASGSVTVDMHAQVPGRMEGELVHLERWYFDKDSLKKLLRPDILGAGYTLFLPWGTYRADISQVQLRMQYVPVRGTPLYADSGLMVLAGPQENLQTARSRMIVPPQNNGPSLPVNMGPVSQTTLPAAAGPALMPQPGHPWGTPMGVQSQGNQGMMPQGGPPGMGMPQHTLGTPGHPSGMGMPQGPQGFMPGNSQGFVTPQNPHGIAPAGHQGMNTPQNPPGLTPMILQTGANTQTGGMMLPPGMPPPTVVTQPSGAKVFYPAGTMPVPPGSIPQR